MCQVLLHSAFRPFVDLFLEQFAVVKLLMESLYRWLTRPLSTTTCSWTQEEAEKCSSHQFLLTHLNLIHGKSTPFLTDSKNRKNLRSSDSTWSNMRRKEHFCTSHIKTLFLFLTLWGSTEPRVQTLRGPRPPTLDQDTHTVSLASNNKYALTCTPSEHTLRTWSTGSISTSTAVNCGGLCTAADRKKTQLQVSVSVVFLSDWTYDELSEICHLSRRCALRFNALTAARVVMSTVTNTPTHKTELV